MIILLQSFQKALIGPQKNYLENKNNMGFEKLRILCRVQNCWKKRKNVHQKKVQNEKLKQCIGKSKKVHF